MADCMTQEDAMNMSIEQAIAILIPMRDMMLDQNGCPISDAYFALGKVIKYAERRGEWEWIGGYGYQYRCSECVLCAGHQTKYCPNCGARMEE